MAKDLVFQLSVEVQEGSYVLMHMSCGRNPRRSIDKCSRKVLERGPILAERPNIEEVCDVSCSSVKENYYCRG